MTSFLYICDQLLMLCMIIFQYFSQLYKNRSNVKKYVDPHFRNLLKDRHRLNIANTIYHDAHNIFIKIRRKLTNGLGHETK